MAGQSKDLFRTRDHVADFDWYVAEYARRSEQSRAGLRCQLDVSYGDGPSERLDLFLPEPTGSPHPIHLFVHGGYWRMFGKQDFSFIADTVVAAGGIAAVIDYALMPAVRMETIVAQVCRAAAWLAGNAADFDGDASRLTASGHSAGAHLCCSLLDTGSPVQLKGALLVSGIYDLEPLRSSFLQPLLGFTDDEVARFSPVSSTFNTLAEVGLLVGALETPPFHQQAERLASRLSGAGVSNQIVNLADANHMSVALDLGTPSTIPGAALVSLVQQF